MPDIVKLDLEDDTAGRGGTHPRRQGRRLLVAPSSNASVVPFNTVEPGLFPIACFRLDDVRFEFDSSFLLPQAKLELAILASVLQQHPNCPLSVFGHADPTGDDAYNKALSGRRAQAIYGMLIRDPALWDELYGQPFGGDVWGDRALGMMRATVPDKATAPRRELFRAYMDALCGESLKLTKGDFLGRGLLDGKGDYQGCSKFNPVLLLSRSEVARLDEPANHDERNFKNGPNRRVVIFFFAPGMQVTQDAWPCPRAKEGAGACHSRFWSNAELRRRPGDLERRYELTRDTFACRFYDRMAMRSPCEAATHLVTFSVRLCDADKQPISGAPYRIVRPKGDHQGYAEPDGNVTIQTRKLPERMIIEWTAPDKEDEPYPYRREFYVDVGDDDQADDRRLYNLGYTRDDRQANVRHYQADLGHEPTGKIEDIREELRRFHDGGNRPASGAGSSEPAESPAG